MSLTPCQGDEGILLGSHQYQPLAEVMCEEDVFCLYDIAATGDTTIGLITLGGGQELEMITNSSQPGVGAMPSFCLS